MKKAWHETRSDEEAALFTSDFWLAHRENLDAGEFWAEKIKRYRGEPVERLRIAIENLPLPAAFREAAIATRALIRAKRKDGEPYEEELTLLYWLAAIDSFSIPYCETIRQPGYNVIESIPGAIIKNLPFRYQDLGYEKLGLLKKTDIEWLRELWGEPQFHTTMHLLHNEVWKEYEGALVEKQQKQLDELVARHVSPDQQIGARPIRKWRKTLIAVAGFLGFVVAFLIAF